MASSRASAGLDPKRINLPHVEPFSTDSPRNANAPSATIATAMPEQASAPIGITTLGSSSRTMIRRFDAPTRAGGDDELALAELDRRGTRKPADRRDREESERGRDRQQAAVEQAW